MAEPTIKRMTLDEFLHWEDETDTRYELIDGFSGRHGAAGGSSSHLSRATCFRVSTRRFAGRRAVQCPDRARGGASR